MSQKVLAMILICGLFGTFHVDAQEASILVITEDWAPYNYVEEDIVKGFSVEVVQAIMEKIGEKHEIKVYPGARGQWMLDIFNC